MKFLAPVHLDRAHEPYLAKFDCGDASLNVWLQTRAVSNEEKKASRTYLVFTDTGDLAGFFSICANVFEHNLMSAASRRNKPDPILVVLIGRLAVDQRYQGGGLGAAMLNFAVPSLWRFTRYPNRRRSSIRITASKPPRREVLS